MKLKDNTILITGGSSGIGLELAKVLTSKGNRVLICGRSAAKLKQAREAIPEVEIFACDLSKQSERLELYKRVAENYPECNVLINNAAVVSRTDFRTDEAMIEKAEAEIQTNFMAPIALSKLFLPLLEKNANPAIINITTGLVYAPKASYPIYNATKAALHSFSQVLRHQLQENPVKIIEVLMTVVDTPWHGGEVPKMAISPQEAVKEMLRKLEKGQQEIRIAKVGMLYLLSRILPRLAFKLINRT
ncbi:SDR family oxidoreductase [Catalinimonas niigatensis]|uniref:SDR family oxidoreductase n=1 Tax=Catalinimonas niigatensis TaxID=1397264 RepID=UPI0026658F2E|nr:SDR family NAD(P)-dependent oxidoreductase [Catalinimonas niigatensis]WPP52408.1 SDR family NAD(P)-dependent oxidoreductase [Catalinimonas niigatensis]